MSTNSRYLRAKEAAKYLGVGLSTVWYYSKQGKIKPIKMSERVTVFKREEFDALVDTDGGEK